MIGKAKVLNFTTAAKNIAIIRTQCTADLSRTERSTDEIFDQTTAIRDGRDGLCLGNLWCRRQWQSAGLRNWNLPVQPDHLLRIVFHALLGCLLPFCIAWLFSRFWRETKVKKQLG